MAETQELARPADLELDQRLTSQAAMDALASAMRAARFAFSDDDVMVIATADGLVIDDADAYTRGYDVLRELGEIERRIKTHYDRFGKPLTFLAGVLTEMRAPDNLQVQPIKKALSQRLGTWKAEQDRKDRDEAAARQRAADDAAKAKQLKKAETLERLAAVESNPQLAQSFREEAKAVAAVDVKAAPVETKTTAPKVAGGRSTTTWKCQFTDVKALMKAWVDGRCVLPEDDIVDGGIQSYMDRQATALQQNLGKAFPGCEAIATHAGVATRRL